jgi:hypothetical protein
MNISFFTHLLYQIKQYHPPLGVSLHLGGEPLLHPHIDILVEEVNRILNIKPFLASNGTLLTKEMIDSLVDARGVRLIIDFCSNRETFERLRSGALWIQVMNSILMTLERGKDHGISISLRCLDRNIRGLEELFDGFENMYILPFRLHNVGGNFAELVERDLNLKIVHRKYRLCTHPWFAMAIAWNGTTVICCHDVQHIHPVGDLTNSSLEEVWFGTRMSRVRRLLIQGGIAGLPLCRTCSRPWDKRNKLFSLVMKYARS